MNPYDFIAEKFSRTKGTVLKTPENGIAIKYRKNDGSDVTIFISPTERSVEHEFARAINGQTLPGSRYVSLPSKGFEQSLFIAEIQATCIMSSLMDGGVVL